MTATQWVEVLTSYSLQVLMVVMTCKLLERATERASDRCSLWNTCFFSIVAIGCAALLLPRLHLLHPWTQLEPQTLLSVSTTQSELGRILLFVWCLGASVSLVNWVVRGHRVRRMLRRCSRLPADEVERLMVLTDVNQHKSKLPEILITDEVDGPFCWQLHAPTIVLPHYLLEGSEDDLRHVLLHEIEHLNTKHPLQLFIQHLAEVLCWFHPAVWRAGAAASLSREYCCDEAAANRGAGCAAYLRTLLHIAERCDRPTNGSMISFGRTPSEIVLRARRLVMLATDSYANNGRLLLGRRTSAGIILTVACCLCLVWLPTDPLASARSQWSPWPSWSAKTAYCFGFGLRDYEQYDPRVQVFEMIHEPASDGSSRAVATDQPLLSRQN